jgi:glucose/arabinose dehydrogenase
MIQGKTLRVSARCCAVIAAALLGPAKASAVETGAGLAQPERAFAPGPPPEDVKLSLEKVCDGLEQPIYLTSPTGDLRLFIIERVGRIRVVEQGDLANEPFLDLTGEVDWAGERGLLGLAFAPDFSTSGVFYVCYTEKRTFDTVVARFRAGRGARSSFPVSIGTREEIIRIKQPPTIDHKAGWIGFRPGEPGYLYVATGDGGGANDPLDVSQDRRNLLGKLLRLDVSADGAGYRIPEDNPFASGEDAAPEIWALGLRNPYRCSFDRFTGDLFIGDVGQDHREEINFEPAGMPGGSNYGWRFREGARANGAVPPPTDETLDFREPIFDYAQADMMFTRGCVIGGYVYRGTAIPALEGAYFFADFTNAQVFSFRYDGRGVSELTDWSGHLTQLGAVVSFSGLSSFGEDDAGELYIVDFAGSVFRIVQSEKTVGDE